METAIRFSQKATDLDQRFLYIDVTNKSLQLRQLTERKGGLVKYEPSGSPTKTPAFRAVDWHPVHDSLVVVGQSSGEATLLNLHAGEKQSLSFQVRNQRFCNAVALNTQHLVAAGLDRVRTDFCLNIWDYQQRLSPMLSSPSTSSKAYTEPLHKLAGSEPITSLKFFQDDPLLLIAGVKGQFLRLYDLREPSSNAALSFSTRCVHNIAIDNRDENYFASCFSASNPTICIWDRRKLLPSSAPVGLLPGQAGPASVEHALELRQPIEEPGVIWSMRFSKTVRGCLGVLSSTGHFKLYDIAKDSISSNEHGVGTHTPRSNAGTGEQEPLYLERFQDVEHPYFHPSRGRAETSRIVSFDFMKSHTPANEPEVIVLTGSGEIKILSKQADPEPCTFSTVGLLLQGHSEQSPSVQVPAVAAGDPISVGSEIRKLRRRVEPRNLRKMNLKKGKGGEQPVDPKHISSFANQSWNADLGYFEKDVPLGDLLSLSIIQKLRCEAGYLFSPAKNKSIVSDSQWLQTFWAWVERATTLSTSGHMVQENLDLSYIGVYSVWMEDISHQSRSIGASSSKMSRSVQALTRRINLPSHHMCDSDYPAHRLLCLYVSGLASTYEELEAAIKQMVSRQQHTKAAAIAIFANERKLAYSALRQKSASQSHKMLAMAIAGASTRGKGMSEEDDGAEDEWSETIAALAEELTDPYARAILALVRSGDWQSVLEEASLPLKYRVSVALRWLSDSALTTYISQATKMAVAQGDIEGVILTGTGTNASVELMGNYIHTFGDLQTAVLALSATVPRYITDVDQVRRFQQWRVVYRHQINSWGLKFDRVRFDIGSSRLAMDMKGKRLIPPPKPQVALVCGFCSQGLAQFDHEQDNGEVKANSTYETQKHPLSSEKAAAIGTVCPKCGRHLPRCGVCDLWLGMPDPSYLKGYAQSSKKMSEPEHDFSTDPHAESNWAALVKKFTVFCIKCNHGFHAEHARQWFAGYSGREGHKICAVSTCQCICNV